MADVPYHKKNMEDASSYYKGSTRQDIEDTVSQGWNKIKGLVGGGEEEKESAMGKALRERRQRLKD
jgi:hypothetical protein